MKKILILLITSLLNYVSADCQNWDKTIGDTSINGHASFAFQNPDDSFCFAVNENGNNQKKYFDYYALNSKGNLLEISLYDGRKNVNIHRPFELDLQEKCGRFYDFSIIRWDSLGEITDTIKIKNSDPISFFRGGSQKFGKILLSFAIGKFLRKIYIIDAKTLEIKSGVAEITPLEYANSMSDWIDMNEKGELFIAGEVWYLTKDRHSLGEKGILAKFNSDFEKVYQININEKDNDFSNMICTKNGSCYASGKSDFWNGHVICFDGGGNIRWETKLNENIVEIFEENGKICGFTASIPINKLYYFELDENGKLEKNTEVVLTNTNKGKRIYGITKLKENGFIMFGGANNPFNNKKSVPYIVYFNPKNENNKTAKENKTTPINETPKFELNEFKNLTEKKIKVYPNPFDNFISFDISSNDFSKLRLEFHSIDGKLIKKLEDSTKQIKLELPDLSSGIYVYKIYLDNKLAFTGKLIKQ